jgi:acetyltransferase-like isoleucine patch superfamily enzyme
MLGEFDSLLQRLRVWNHRRRWSCTRITGSPHLVQPALLMGAGRIEIGEGVTIGWHLDPGYYRGCSWIEARTEPSLIRIGAYTHLNCDARIFSEGPGVLIGEHCLIGPTVEIFDTDAHALDPGMRSAAPAMGQVVIGDSVFLGSRVTVLKGVTIGQGTVVGAGSVVTTSLPARVVAAGNPARVLRSIDGSEAAHPVGQSDER